MKKTLFKSVLSIILISSIARQSMAAGAGTSGALTLIESPSARFSALAGASTASQDDVSAFQDNPAVLGTMKTGQALFMYQKGLAEDSYGKLAIGAPRNHSGLGLSVAYYNAGQIELNDGVSTRQVNAQKDVAVSLGYARTMGVVSMGLTGKYFQSELIDTYKATAYAADFGLSLPLSSRMRMGAAVQNIGTQVTYISEGDNLPRIGRLGASYVVVPGMHETTLFLDAPYYMNERELRPAAGLEILVGPLAVRGGYRKSKTTQEFSVGTGFNIARASLDYSLGMAQNLDATHRISVSMRFGNGKNATPEFVNKEKEIKNTEVASTEPEKRYSLGGTASFNTTSTPSSTRRVYTVKPGDTLGTIAKEEYGTAANWQLIYSANKHLIDDPRKIEVGQKIVLP